MLMERTVQYREICYLVIRSCYSCLCCVEKTEVAIEQNVLYRQNRC